ncbi:hypothetical protein D3C85_1663510 [compost metagenome]
MSYKTFDIETTLRDKCQEGFHVALLCETDITKRVIIAIFFIERVITAWTIGA